MLIYNADTIYVRNIRIKRCRVGMRFGELGAVNNVILNNIRIDEFDYYGLMFVKNIDKVIMYRVSVKSSDKPLAEAVLFSHNPRISKCQYINDVIIINCEFGAYDTSNIEIYGCGVDRIIIINSRFYNHAKIGHIYAKFAIIIDNIFENLNGGMSIDGKIIIDDTQSPPVTTREHIAHIIAYNLINYAPS